MLDTPDWVAGLILLASLAAFFAPPVRRLSALPLAAAIAVAFRMWIPAEHTPHGAAFLYLVLAPAALLAAYGLARAARRSEFMRVTGKPSPAAPFAPPAPAVDGIALLAFAAAAVVRAFMDWETPPGGSRVNRTGFDLVLAYGFLRGAPWTFLPARALRRFGVFLLTLALGLMVLRSAAWGYHAFQAFADSPLISFHLNGPVNAREDANHWRFRRLAALIEEHRFDNRKTLRSEWDRAPREYELLRNGLTEAEEFRLEWLEPDERGYSKMDLAVEAMRRFQTAAAEHLDGRPALDGFELSPGEILSIIRGESPLHGTAAFGAFAGKWYGNWDGMDVDHDWTPAETYDPPPPLDEGGPLCVRSLQYAWIGDGFGWNAVVSPGCRNTGDVVLGTVYHVENGDPEAIRLHRPHVGVPLLEGQLIWITRGEVFLEEAFFEPSGHGEPVAADRYAITGFYYEFENGALTTPRGGFQAVYTRNPADRPEWLSIPAELRVQPPFERGRP